MNNYTGDWYGLYRERWGDDIVPDAYAHPAKYARGLIRAIYAHLIEQGYIKPGDTVLDPFGGVGLGALDAMRNGLRWWGNELEEKFVKLGNQNIILWNKRYGSLWPDTWGSAVLTQGDSRELAGMRVEGVVSSPPWLDNLHNHEPAGDIKARWGDCRLGGEWASDYGTSPGQLAAMKAGDLEAAVSSPPYNLPMSQDHSGRGGGDRGHTPSEPGAFARYGNTPGQIEGLPMTDEGLQAVVSSPPFGEGETRDRAPVQGGHVADCITRAYTQDKQGSTPGNLAHMKAVVSSPPYEASRTDQEFQRKAANREIDLSMPEATKGYGDSGIGRERTQEAIDDFWTAARQIVDQCYLLLKPGAVAVWVVKRFVRDKKIVDFPDQWRRMCESAGFETVEWIRAWVVEEHGEQMDLFGNSHTRKVERKSFFRRLYESKYPHNAIDWEDVLIMRRT